MEIEVLVEEGIAGCPEESWIRGIAKKVMLAEGVSANAELSLVITTQEKIRELNRRYRGKDEPTDVLAFYLTSGESTDLLPFVAPPDGVLHLGEVIISFPQAVLQAKQHRHSVKRELAILIIHGVLHLLGYDHDKPEPKRKMRAREKEILGRIAEELD